MVGSGGQLFGIWLGRADAHFPIKLAAVRRYDFGAEMLGQPNGCLRFSRGGRPAYHDEIFFTRHEILLLCGHKKLNDYFRPMLYSITLPFAKIALGTYFRKVYISNIENLPKDKPVLLAANHPTAFIEPCILACWLPRKLSYLARGDLYMNNLIIRKVYDWYHMTPVFRLEDAGYGSLKNNYASFDRCFDAFRDQRVVMILAEGRTKHEKRLRPMMKGAARIVFGTFEKYPDLDLQVVPVGVNFSNSDEFRSIAMIDVGEPIPAREYLKMYEESPARAVNQMTREIRKGLIQRVIHIADEEDDDWVEPLLQMTENDFGPQFPRVFSPDSTLLFRQKKLTENVNAMSKAEKASLREKVVSYQKKLAGYKADDLGVVSRKESNFSNLIKLILLFPFQLTGLILNIPPIFLGNSIAKKIAPAIEFRAATAGVFASVLWGIWVIVLALGIYSFMGKAGLWLLLLLPACGYIHLIYREIRRKFGAAVSVNRIPEKTLEEILRERKKILKTVLPD